MSSIGWLVIGLALGLVIGWKVHAWFFDLGMEKLVKSGQLEMKFKGKK